MAGASRSALSAALEEQERSPTAGAEALIAAPVRSRPWALPVAAVTGAAAGAAPEVEGGLCCCSPFALSKSSTPKSSLSSSRARAESAEVAEAECGG